MVWTCIGICIILGIIFLICAFLDDSNDPSCAIMGLTFLFLGLLIIAFHFTDKANRNVLNKKYPAEKKYEFYKIYTEDNKEEYVLDPKFVNGTIVVDGKIYTKYSGYKKLTREEAAGHYK